MLRLFISRNVPSPSPSRYVQVFHRCYRATSRMQDTDSASGATMPKEEEITVIQKKMAARDYNNRRAAYNRQVSLLRKQYAETVARQRAADKAEKEALERELTRRRLERQRLKNIRSAQNAIKQQQLREQRQEEFEEHLRVQQILREAKKERYLAARQLVVDELEEEAPLWLTTVDEVEAAFTPEAEQLLWARPGGILGAPNPSLDAHFWQYETHTWHMNRKYKTKREVLLEELEERAYEEANIDEAFWTEERLEEQQRLEERARLRAMVHSAGRTELLKIQKQMLDKQYEETDGDVLGSRPVPNLRILNNDRALEKEGAKLLMQDPTKFFIFDNSPTGVDSEMKDGAAYEGPTLGAPVALRDPLRDGSYQNEVFPVPVGKIPKPDTRTEREKKQQERQERMLAAAAAEQRKEADINLDTDEQELEDLSPDVDYNDEYDSDDQEWEKGLDRDSDADIINTPRERRYTEDDIDWVLENLDTKMKHLEQQFAVEMESMKEQVRSELRAKGSALVAPEVASKDNLEAALLSLTEKELIALSDLDEAYSETMTDADISNALKDIPSLSKEQVMFILTRDRSGDN